MRQRKSLEVKAKTDRRKNEIAKRYSTENSWKVRRGENERNEREAKLKAGRNWKGKGKEKKWN